MMKIGFIGVGNMGGAILKGLIEKGFSAPEDVLAFDADPAKLKEKCESCGISSCESAGELVRSSDIIILGVKPDVFSEILPEIAKSYVPEKTLISMAAGIGISFIEKYLGSTAKIIRIMPNTPAMVGEAMTAVAGNRNITEKGMEQALSLFRSIGKAEEVAEELIHCVIGVSGSSPAYTYMYIDALADTAVKNGMEREKALTFAAQAVLGAAKMVLETGVDPVQLRINVCSPGGTTIEAVLKLQENGFEKLIAEGFSAAVEKSKLMAKK